MGTILSGFPVPGIVNSMALVVSHFHGSSVLPKRRSLYPPGPPTFSVPPTSAVRGTNVLRQERLAYMRKMPNLVGGMGALMAAEMPSASAWRVSVGSSIPSSQRRAVL